MVTNDGFKSVQESWHTLLLKDFFLVMKLIRSDRFLLNAVKFQDFKKTTRKIETANKLRLS